ncbi:MAG: TrmJ/YjtD family RNA methyltransferase [Acidobacteriaceae bacterium]|nr:TrmJ/YjtD family RNA methyltransferase [Acidobacteriaceae bacterium]
MRKGCRDTPISSNSRLRIVLVEPRNPLNIGAVARAMSNFGFLDLRLVKPYEVAFREARSAVRSHYILESAQVFDNVQDAIADCTLVAGTTAVGHRDLHLPLYRLEPAAELIEERLASSGVALLFGSEKFGLTNEQMSFCDWLLRIPTREEHGSMNLGQAVAICLYELRRSSAAAAERFPPADPVSAADRDRITSLLLELLGRSGYVNERTAASTELKVRRLVRRLGVPAGDAETWLGIFRQILWKLSQTDSR